MTTTIIKNTNIIIKNEIDLVIGVYDVGLTNWITLSDGQVIDRPKFLAKSLKKKIKTLQRRLSKKKKGSLCTQLRHILTCYKSLL